MMLQEERSSNNAQQMPTHEQVRGVFGLHLPADQQGLVAIYR